MLDPKIFVLVVALVFVGAFIAALAINISQGRPSSDKLLLGILGASALLLRVLVATPT